MNYLAHAYLSFSKPGIVVGNMISDFVKGKKKFDFPIAVQNGIALHRMIDTYTDTHPVTREAAKVFKPMVGLYAGAFVDVVYDHFLATDDQQFSGKNLNVFAQETYQILYHYENILPDRFATMLPYMKQQDWLYNYSTIGGTEKSFAGVAKRAVYLNSSQLVFEAFMANYALLKQHYQSFFPDIKAFAFAQLANFKEK